MGYRRKPRSRLRRENTQGWDKQLERPWRTETRNQEGRRKAKERQLAAWRRRDEALVRA